MKTQSFSNHVRVHPLYHYFAVPFSLVLILLSLIGLITNFTLGSVIIFAAAVLIHLAIFLSRDYAKKNQDRTIRNELRLRYFLLTGKPLHLIEHQFTIGQLLAMRFASDEELMTLIQNPDSRLKTPEEIKKNITNWNPDWMRI